MTKRRRATPRLYKPASWEVGRLPRFQPRPGHPIADVVMVTFQGEWEHAQRQQIRIPVPVDLVRQLAVDLLGAVPPAAPENPGDGRVASVPSPGTSSPQLRAAAGGGAPRAPSPAPADRHGYVLDLLEQRIGRYFDGRDRARDAWLQSALRRYEAPALADLEVSALAQLFNELQAAPASRSIQHPQGEHPHGSHPHPDDGTAG